MTPGTRQTVPVWNRFNSDTLSVHYDAYNAAKFVRIGAKTSMQGTIKRLSYYHAMLVRGLDTRKNHNTGLARATRMARGGLLQAALRAR